MALPQREAVSTSTHGRVRMSKYSAGPQPSGLLPFHAIHLAGRFLRLLSVYIVYHYLTLSGTSVVTFMSICLSISAVLFLLLQRPWRGRALSTSQLMPTIVNGGVLALSFVLWGRGLRDCGPVRTVLAEYAGAALGAVSTLLFGRDGQRWRKVGGLVGMLASFFFLSQGWAMATRSPFAFRNKTILEENIHEKGYVGLKSMTIPILAGLLAALRRVIARRVSLKTQLKKRLHAVTVASAACFLFPFTILELTLTTKNGGNIEQQGFSTWPYAANIIFGTILIFYVDAFVEERLRILVSSPKHLMVTGGCISILELFYGMDFSFLGFLVCLTVLGLGIFEATSLERSRRDMAQIPIQMSEITEAQDSLIMPPLPA